MKPRPATLRIVHSVLALALGVSTAHAVGTPQTKANTTTLNLGTDWVSGTLPTSADTATWQSSPITLAKNVTLTLGGSVSCFNFDMRTSTGTGGSAGAGLVIGNDGLGSVLNLYSNVTANNQCALDQGNGVVSTVINCPIAIFNNTAFRNSNSGDMTIGGSIGESGGSKSLTFNGNGGWVRLSGANTYTGGTIMGSGAGNLLTLSGSGTLGAAGTNLTLPTASTSGVFLDLGGTTQTQGAVNLGQACLIQNGTLNATNLNVGASAYGVFNVNLGGASGLTLNNSGKLSILSGTNTWSGTTTVTAGTLLATQPAALPSSGSTSTIAVTGAAGVLAVRAGAAAGEWAAADVSALLANSNFTFSAAGALGIDTTGGDFSYGSAIPNKTNNGLAKLGPNTLTLSAANLYPGPTTISRGTLKLTGSIPTTSVLTFTGTGTFNYDNTAAGGATAISFAGGPTFSVGEATVRTTRSVNQNQALTFGGVSRTAGATASFINGGDSSGNGVTNGINLTQFTSSFVNQGTFYDGADFAFADANHTLRAPIYGTDSGFTTADTLTASTHAKLTSTPAAQNSITLNTLNLAGSGVGFPLNSLQALTLANNGIVKSGGGSGGTISGGGVFLTNSASVKELVIRTDSSSDALTISSQIGAGAMPTGTIATASAVITGMSSTSGLVAGMACRTNGGTNSRTILSVDSGTQVTLSGTPGGTAGAQQIWFGYTTDAVTKSGAGTLTLSGVNVFGGGVNLNAGQLNLNSTTALGGGVTASGTTVGAFTINQGTTLDNTSGGPLTMTIKYPLKWNGDFTFVGTSDLGFIDPSGNGNITMPNDVTVTVATLGSTLKSASNFTLTTAKLTKSGPGTLFIGSNGGFGANGGLVINEGVFAGSATGAQADGIFSGPVGIGDTTAGNTHTAILDMATGQQHTAPITARAGSTGTLAIVGESSATLCGPMTLNNALTLTAPSGSTFSQYGVISGGSNLSIGNTGTFVVFGTNKSLTNAGTVKLFNRNTYTGNTVVNSGTLALGALGTIDTSPLVSLAAGTTFDVSAVPTPYTLSGSTTLAAKGTGTSSATYARIVGPSGGAVSLGAQPVNLTFTPTGSSGDTTHPSLLVSQGALTLNNNVIAVVNNGPALGAGVYQLIQVTSGTTTGAPSTAAVSVTGSGGLAANSEAYASVSSGNVILTVTTKSVTSFSGLTLSQTIQQGTATVTLGGTISATGPVYPADGELIHVTINGVTQNTNVSGGTFSLSFSTAALVGSPTPYTITYGYPGSGTLTTATDTSTALTVTTQSVPVITSWPSANGIIYGQDLTSSSINGDGVVSTPGAFTFTAPSTIPVTVGTYTASGTFTPTDTVHYSTVVVPGAISVSVSQKEVTLTAAAVTNRPYTGNTAATITGTLNGVLPGDIGQVTLVGTGVFEAPAPAAATGITVDATSSLSGAKSANYFLTQPSGLTGDIVAATLTVKADNLGRPEGIANPTLTYTVSGYQGSNNAASVGLSGTPSLTTLADLSSPEGSYPITCAPNDVAITDPNYSLAFVDGTLQVVGLRTWAKGNGVWDIQTSLNWSAASGPATYVDGGEVAFADPTSFGLGPFAVTLNTSVHPYSVTMNNPTKDYSIAGTGSIGGQASVLKQGAGMLTLSTANSYSGGTTVNGGSLTLDKQTGLGTGPVTLAGGTTFEQSTFEGNSSAGALPNAFVLSGGNVTMNIPFAYKDIWLSNPVSGPGGLTIQGGGRGITLAGNNTFAGGMIVKNGDLRVYITNNNSLGTGTFRTESTTAGSGGGRFEVSANLSTAPGVANAIDIASGAYLNVNADASNSLLLSGPITSAVGVGSVNKYGSATLTLAGSNTYSGNTIVSAGTVVLDAAGKLGFVITNAAANKVTGAGTATLNGSFTLDTSAVTNTTGTWTLVDAATKSFGAGFSVVGYTPNIDGVTWTLAVGTQAWSFNTTTGMLTLAVGAVSDYDSWAGSSGYNLSGGPTGDDDHDGVSNFTEYAFGLNPTSGTSVNPISQPLTKAGLFKYTRRATPATTGLAYTYEWSTTLSGAWSAFTPDSAVSNGASPVEEISVNVPAALLLNTKLFVRVKAE